MADVEKKLVETSNPRLPEDFLKRWLMAVNEKPLTMEQINAEFDTYAKAMQWKLIENKIIKDNNLTVTPEEATEEAKNFIRSQYARYGQTPNDEEVAKLVKTILTKESEVQKIYDNLYASKMLKLFKEKSHGCQFGDPERRWSPGSRGYAPARPRDYRRIDRQSG